MFYNPPTQKKGDVLDVLDMFRRFEEGFSKCWDMFGGVEGSFGR